MRKRRGYPAKNVRLIPPCLLLCSAGSFVLAAFGCASEAAVEARLPSNILDAGATVVLAPDGEIPISTDASAFDLDAGTLVANDSGGEMPEDIVPDEVARAANPNWIGGVCEADADCTYEGGRCESSGTPYGICTKACTYLCPDQTGAEYSSTFCIDGLLYGSAAGTCVSQCDTRLYGATGCPVGFFCVEANRFAMPESVRSACVPETTSSCSRASQLIDLAYPDDGKIWVSGTSQCEGRADLVVMLHGINPQQNRTPSLSGGRRLELLAQLLMDRGLIQPIVLAEPVHLVGTSGELYDERFDPIFYLQNVQSELAQEGVTINAVSFTGHSGAGCDVDNGLYKVARSIEAIEEIGFDVRFLGLEDTCYGSSVYASTLDGALRGTDIDVFNMWSTMGDPGSFEEAFLEDSVPFPCDPTIFESCVRHRTERRWSYRTRSEAGITHNNNPYFFLREVLPRVFVP